MKTVGSIGLGQKLEFGTGNIKRELYNRKLINNVNLFWFDDRSHFK